jgi:transcriptional regulator with XRE-family HTH domain
MARAPEPYPTANAATEASTDPATMVARRVRALREARGLSLRDLAERTGVSVPMLSQVERGDSSPTLSVAWRIAAGLELSLSQLLRLDEGSHAAVARAGARAVLRRGGHRSEELAPPAPGRRAGVTLHTLKGGARTGAADDAPLHESGSRETIYLQSGSLRLDVDGEVFDLAAGDAATFDADLPHRIDNPGRADATFVAVVTAGLRTT